MWQFKAGRVTNGEKTVDMCQVADLLDGKAVASISSAEAEQIRKMAEPVISTKSNEDKILRQLADA